jgi:hypothetical protein
VATTAATTNNLHRFRGMKIQEEIQHKVYLAFGFLRITG